MAFWFILVSKVHHGSLLVYFGKITVFFTKNVLEFLDAVNALFSLTSPSWSNGKFDSLVTSKLRISTAYLGDYFQVIELKIRQ